ncbi:branched-chain amino acid ABC transporter permease [Acuticoccus sp. I52.16.1]|uniref:branched-chain amino acid ABC transporter permease n=1 Tax=Acuticoccus sp. I52.16.1 TaxID=2928472 RepID=UPI001FD24EEA|nr:branched-chain amino acid ABC transporter permease [Acuticoccus sp. I52.16.1]UOM37274.1 branched-chain amino acid ABC transporter permease [Acuticoccus sp. I52.16.1]
MSPQVFVDGLVSGSMIGLGAIGLTLVYSILRFPNFAHGELVTAGAYIALTLAGLIGAAVGVSAPIGPFSFGWTVILAALLAMGGTALLALALDRVLFARLRRHGAAVIIVVMASFGASLALRAAIEFAWTSSPAYFTRELQIAMRLAGGVRVTPDQLAALGLTAVLVVAVHLLVAHTAAGRAMRAVRENPSLAALAGIDVARTIRLVWVLGAALACAAGVTMGLLVQIRPTMGFDLLLPLFAAAILGGVGSLPGAVVGGLVVGIGEAMTVALLGAEWRAGAAFMLLVAILMLRPSGIFGQKGG